MCINKWLDIYYNWYNVVVYTNKWKFCFFLLVILNEKDQNTNWARVNLQKCLVVKNEFVLINKICTAQTKKHLTFYTPTYTKRQCFHSKKSTQNVTKLLKNPLSKIYKMEFWFVQRENKRFLLQKRIVVKTHVLHCSSLSFSPIIIFHSMLTFFFLHLWSPFLFKHFVNIVRLSKF